MPKPLRLFIPPPYTGTPNPIWTLVHGFGLGIPGPSPFHTYARFRTGGQGEVRAACDGVLATRLPWSSFFHPAEPLIPAEPQPPAGRVNLYLILSPQIAARAAFNARSQAGHTLLAFSYRNLDRASLETHLAGVIANSTLGGTVTPAQAVSQLLSGARSIPVTAGTVIAQAGASTTPGAPAGTREIGFGALCRTGYVDPSFIYEWMREFVEDGQPDIDQFLLLSPVKWPILERFVPVGDIIARTASEIFSWSVLEEFRTSRRLNRAQWRQVRANQKAIYRNRLLVRAGRPPTGSTEPPFEFNDEDDKNLFQLEALVEFYANFSDPWDPDPGAAPRDPGGVGYITVDLSDPSGVAATVNAQQVTLDLGDGVNLSRVRSNVDTITLDSDTARTGRTYKITAINGGVVTVDAAPNVIGATSWRINLSPVLVVIDPFGARQRGAATSYLQGDGAVLARAGVVQFDTDVADLDRVNYRRQVPAGQTAIQGNYESGAFDTIYLPSDTAPAAAGRPARTYRILSVNTQAREVTVDGTPNFGGGTSAWHIPAGVSGRLLPLMDYNLGLPDRQEANVVTKGRDHYDGILFVVYASEVQRHLRTSSFTSRNYNATSTELSSVRGNQRYHVASYRSPAPNNNPESREYKSARFRNYCFKVEDFGTAPATGGEASAGNDTVQEARYYFDLNARVRRDADGKGSIRLHRGTRNGETGGTGSAGCLVSPTFNDLRDTLIQYHREKATSLGEQLPLYARRLEGVSYDTAAGIWHNTNQAQPAGQTLTDGQWNNLLICTLWLIRPDERPQQQ
jgi:hypothetical protein